MNRWLIGYVAIVGAVMVIATVQNVYRLDAGAWASWVQAIGSIAAIIGAVWISSDQHRRSMKQKQIDRLEADAVLARRLNILAYDFTFILLGMGVGRRGMWIFNLDENSISDLLVRLHHYECDENDDYRAGLVFDLRRLIRELQLLFPVQSDGGRWFKDDFGRIKNLYEQGEHICAQTKAASEGATNALGRGMSSAR